MSDLDRELSAVLNKHSAENGSNTPDFILAEYVVGCLHAFNEAVRHRDDFCGRPKGKFRRQLKDPKAAWEKALSPDRKRLRDEFAMATLTGLLATHGDGWGVEEMARFAYKQADAMLDARKPPLSTVSDGMDSAERAARRAESVE